jgi:outer membrane receptor protein involved in Fe transport
MQLELTLRPTGIEERVIVTASRGALQQESEIPATVMALDQLELQTRAVDLLPRMLDEEPGILTQQTTPGQGSPILRGQSAQAVLYLLDGIRYNNATYRAGNTQYLAWVPDAAVQEVEVQLGPAAVGYGSDALGGAVNVLTNAVPGYSQATRVNGGFRLYGSSSSTGGGGSGTIGASGSRGAGFVTANGAAHGDLRGGGARDSHHATVIHLGFTDEQVRDAFGNRYVDTGYQSRGITAKGTLKTSATGSITGFFAGSNQYDVRRYDRLLGGQGRVRADFDPQTLSFGYLRYEQYFADTFFEATASINRQTDGRFDQRHPTSTPRREKNSDTVLGLEATASRAFGPHLVTTGFEVYRDHVDATRVEFEDGAGVPVRPRVPDGSRYTSLGFFLMDEWSTLGDRLQLSGGLRYSAFWYRSRAADNIIAGVAVAPDTEQSFDDLTFNIGAHFAITPDLGMWGRVARGFRAPSIFDLGEIGLTGGGFEAAPGEAAALNGLIGDSAARNALSTGVRWANLSPEVLWSYEGGFRWVQDDLRLEITAFDSSFVDTISRRVIVVDQDVVGQSIGGQTIIAQDDAGRIYTAVDPDPVVSRANIGELRIWGLEFLAQRPLGDRWLATVKASLQRGKELDTGFFARKIAPDNLTARLRWRSRSGNLWIEGVFRGALTQDRLNPGDLDDTRIGAFRDADDIGDFFINQGPRLGLVQDGILIATGETLDEVVARVLGPTGAGAALFTETPGWASFGIRGNWQIARNQSLLVALNNLTDANYRMHGSGFDSAGINLSLAYRLDF